MLSSIFFVWFYSSDTGNCTLEMWTLHCLAPTVLVNACRGKRVIPSFGKAMYSKVLQHLLLPSVGNRNIFSCWSIFPANLLSPHFFPPCTFGLNWNHFKFCLHWKSLGKVLAALQLTVPTRSIWDIYPNQYSGSLRSLTNMVDVIWARPPKYSGTCILIFT